MLSAHYRSPINFSAELMEASKNGLERIITAADLLKRTGRQMAEGAAADQKQSRRSFLKHRTYVQKFEAAMDDDFNTADAISCHFRAGEVFQYPCGRCFHSPSRFVCLHCGKNWSNPYVIFWASLWKRKTEILDERYRGSSIAARQQAARKEKNFARADEIRG